MREYLGPTVPKDHAARPRTPSPDSLPYRLLKGKLLREAGSGSEPNALGLLMINVSRSHVVPQILRTSAVDLSTVFSEEEMLIAQRFNEKPLPYH